MKRSFVSILVCLVVGMTYAQPRLEQEEMYVGFHAGAMASMAIFSPDVAQEITQPYLGANGGFIFRYSGHKVCGLQVELNYLQRGWHESETGVVRSFDYLELPFLTHLAFGKKFRGFINLGPQIGYALRETSTNLVGTPTQPQHLPIDNRFDWGVAGGLGMLYRSQAGVWQLEARFNYSFGGYYSDSKFAYFSKSIPMALSLNFAWMWQIK